MKSWKTGSVAGQGPFLRVLADRSRLPEAMRYIV